MDDNAKKNIRIASSNPKLQEKMFVKFTPDSNTIYWYIKFNVPLDESTLTEDTMFVTDLAGYKMRTFIEYSTEHNLISISPIDTYSKNTYYILQVTKAVKSKKGNNLKQNINIVFKLVNNEIENYEVLKQETKVPKTKERPRNYDPENVTSKVYGFSNEEFNKKGQDNLAYLPFKINPFIGIIGLLIVIVGILMMQLTIALVGVFISIIGVIHLFMQIINNEKRAAYIYNQGVRKFRAKNYESAKKTFEKAFELDPYNEHIEFALNRVKYYL